MSTKWTSAIILTSGLLLTGCTSEETLQVETLREVSATLNRFKLGESMTRTAYNISEETGFQTVWAEGDVLGIYPIGGDQVSFPLSDGVGTTTAKFDGGSWALRGTYEYAAYYPFSTDFYTIDQTAIPVSYLGQVQTGNNSTAHLAAYDFMAAAGTQPSSNGSVDLQFNHVGCFLRMQLTMPNAGTYTSVSIETDGGSFTTQGTVNLAATTPALSATATSEKLTLGLNNVTTTAANQTIVLYMMVAPGNLSTHTLTFTVEDDAENTYTKTATGMNMVATYAYDYSLTFEASGTGGSTGGAWDKENNTYMGHEYVDLGITDEQGRTIYWATCNVGAESPEDRGLYFMWGDTEGHLTEWATTQNDGYLYKWSTAPFNNGNASYDESYFMSVMDEECPDGVLAAKNDAAHLLWGGDWRMPTYEEFEALRKQCTISLTSQDTYIFYTFLGPNGKSIVMANTGNRDSNRLSSRTAGCYWSSSLVENDYYRAYYLNIQGSKTTYTDVNPRCYGMPIRPVFCPAE